MLEPTNQAVVARYENKRRAEAALRALQLAGVSAKRLDILPQPDHGDGLKPLRRVARWSATGALRGAVCAVAAGSLLFLLSLTSPRLVVGEIAGWLLAIAACTVAGGAIGALIALVWSVAVTRTEHDERRRHGEGFLVAVSGDAALVQSARELLAEREPTL